MGAGTDTQSVLLVSENRMVNLEARKETKIETAPVEVVDEVLSILATLVEPEQGY